MISTDTFWEQMGAYNQDTFLLQVALIVIAIVLIYLIYKKPGISTDKYVKLFFAFAFLWNGIVFFLMYAKGPISTFVGAPLFLILAVLFIIDIFRANVNFRISKNKLIRNFTIFWIILVFLYPLIGALLGHGYPKTCMPMAPCPLTVLAIALVSASVPRISKTILVLLLPWALLGLPKCLGALDCYEDCILFFAGVYGLIILLRNRQKIDKIK